MGLNLVHLFGHLTAPVMPTIARMVHATVMEPPDMIPWPDEPMAQFLDQLEHGKTIQSPDVLFAKISEEQLAEWTARFGGADA
jgi:methionyl-tRNA synthetase